MKVDKSKLLFEEAKKYIPGGVNSPVRAFKAVEDIPRFIEKGKGPFIFDVDGNKYIDYVMSWGPLILGHAPKKVIEAIVEQAKKGTSYGAPTPLEVEIAKFICENVPGVEKIRMVNSGTEATMSAIRLARGYTGRKKVIKFEGCYHGHVDSLLVKAGSGLATFGKPSSPGVPEELAALTITLPFNDINAFKKAVLEHKGEIACVILEPVMANAGLILPEKEFLKELRNITAEEGIILIFDEVITGFRLSLGGAQEYFGVIPDLSTFGKVIGGGLPVGAFGGKREIMDYLSPEGPVYQAGTLSGNPLAMAAGLMTLKLLKYGKVQKLQDGSTIVDFFEEGEEVYDYLRKMGKAFAEAIDLARKETGMDKFTRTYNLESLNCLFFVNKEIKSFKDASKANTKAYALFFREMLKQGVYLAPSQFEVAFVSTAHTKKEIEKTYEAAVKALKTVKEVFYS